MNTLDGICGCSVWNSRVRLQQHPHILNKETSPQLSSTAEFTVRNIRRRASQTKLSEIWYMFYLKMKADETKGFGIGFQARSDPLIINNLYSDIYRKSLCHCIRKCGIANTLFCMALIKWPFLTKNIYIFFQFVSSFNSSPMSASREPLKEQVVKKIQHVTT